MKIIILTISFVLSTILYAQESTKILRINNAITRDSIVNILRSYNRKREIYDSLNAVKKEREIELKKNPYLYYPLDYYTDKKGKTRIAETYAEINPSNDLMKELSPNDFQNIDTIASFFFLDTQIIDTLNEIRKLKNIDTLLTDAEIQPEYIDRIANTYLLTFKSGLMIKQINEECSDLKTNFVLLKIFENESLKKRLLSKKTKSIGLFIYSNKEDELTKVMITIYKRFSTKNYHFYL